MDLIKFILMAFGGVCMTIAGKRHKDWRNGLYFVASVFFAVACDSVSDRFLAPILPFMKEPEVLLSFFCVLIGAYLVKRNRSSAWTAAGVIYNNRRFPLLVWGLVFIIFVPNIAKNRNLWEFFEPKLVGVNTVLMRHTIEDITELLGAFLLFNWGFLFLKDKWRVINRHNDEEFEQLLRENKLERVGFGGSRRNCYKLGDSGLCVKFYKPPSECKKGLMKDSIRREIRARRFNKYRNVNSREVDVYNRFRHEMPEEVRSKLPPVCKRVFHPELGWGVLETYYANPDGEAIIPYEFEIARQTPEKKAIIYAQAKDLLAVLVRSAAPFYEPGNFHTLINPDGTIETKLIDFEPTGKTLIQLEAVWPAYRRKKLKRKAARYLAHIREKYDVADKSLLWLTIEGAYGTKFKALTPVTGGNYSENYRAITEHGKSYFIKLTDPVTAARLKATYSGLATSLVPGLAFGGKLVEFGKRVVLAYEWCEGGKYVDPERLDVAKIDSLLESYERLSQVMGKAKDAECPDDIQVFDFGMSPRVVHGDMHTRNVLFDGDVVVGYVDFELLRVGYPTEDLLRIFIHALERTRFWKLKRIAAIENNLRLLMSRSRHPKAAWLSAVNLHEKRKSESRRRKKKVKIIADIDAFFRRPFYLMLKRLVEKSFDDLGGAK